MRLPTPHRKLGNTCTRFDAPCQSQQVGGAARCRPVQGAERTAATYAGRHALARAALHFPARFTAECRCQAWLRSASCVAPTSVCSRLLTMTLEGPLAASLLPAGAVYSRLPCS